MLSTTYRFLKYEEYLPHDQHFESYNIKHSCRDMWRNIFKIKVEMCERGVGDKENDRERMLYLTSITFFCIFACVFEY